MVVKIKDIEGYEIYIEKTTTTNNLGLYVCLIPIIPFTVVAFYNPIVTMNFTNSAFDMYVIARGVFITLMSMPLAMLFVVYDPFKWFQECGYHIYTTHININGKTIRKTIPEQDHIAICRAAQEIEKEIHEHINKEKELEEIVGMCK
jgi:uncharacterized membrane protein